MSCEGCVTGRPSNPVSGPTLPESTSSAQNQLEAGLAVYVCPTKKEDSKSTSRRKHYTKFDLIDLEFVDINYGE